MFKWIGKLNWKQIVFWFVLLSLAFSIVRTIVQFIGAPVSQAEGEPYTKVKADYLLIILQCTLGAVIIFLPSILERRLRIEIPSYMHIVFIVFLYAAIYLGEVQNFYYNVPHWDSILHIFSGIMLGAMGFSLVDLINRHKQSYIQLSPVFIALFAFCFSVTLGALWEVYEYSFDGLLGLNMQKYRLDGGTMLSGRLALQDTMKDLIVDCLGALLICAAGYLQIKARISMQKRQQKWENIGMMEEADLPAEQDRHLD